MRRGIALPATVALAVCVALAGYARADIVSGLAGYWPLDSDAADATGDGHDGTIKGGVTCAADRFGYYYYALHFPGQPQAYIDLGQPAGLLVHRAMTVAAWVRAENLGQGGQIIAKQESLEDRSWSLQLAAGGIARFEIAGDRTTRIRADSRPLTFGPTEWFHVAGVFRPGEAVELWLNARLVATQPTTITSHYVGNDESIRISGGAGGPWQGDIDEVRLYARALAPADINDLCAFRPTPHFKAWDPQPADGAVGVMYWFLMWKQGVTAVLDDLYFGDAPTLGPEDFMGRMPGPGSVYFGWPALMPGATYYWRVDEAEGDGKTVHTGDVWHFTSLPYTAIDPWPADGAKSVSAEMDLSWSVGIDAGSHDVYFGTDAATVVEGAGDTFKGRQPGTRFDPGPLQMGTTYYWRVDEVSRPDPYHPASTKPPEIWKGPVWSFTTADFPVIDDFESYGDEEGYRIDETWISGWWYVPDYWPDPFVALERQIVHSGRQSMAFDYNNVFSPYYSEAKLWFATAQDWTINGIDTLVLYIRGLAANDPAPIYVSIEDSTHKADTVVHPDPQLTATTEWIEWQIPLGRLTNINPAKVRQFRIGVGNPEDRHPGGLGRIYIDDIRVIKSGQ